MKNIVKIIVSAVLLVAFALVIPLSFGKYNGLWFMILCSFGCVLSLVELINTIIHIKNEDASLLKKLLGFGIRAVASALVAVLLGNVLFFFALPAIIGDTDEVGSYVYVRPLKAVEPDESGEYILVLRELGIPEDREEKMTWKFYVIDDQNAIRSFADTFVICSDELTVEPGDIDKNIVPNGRCWLYLDGKLVDKGYYEADECSKLSIFFSGVMQEMDREGYSKYVSDKDLKN